MSLSCNTSTIQILRWPTPLGLRAQRQEVTQDCYILSTPLGWGHSKVIESGRILHDGDVRPGMLRLMSPGDSVTMTGTVMEGAYAVVPGPLFRKLATPPGKDELRGRLTIRPLTKPDRRIDNLFAMLLSAKERERHHRDLIIDGLTRALIAILLEHHHRPKQTQSNHAGRLSQAEFERCVEYARSMIAVGLELDSWACVLNMPTAEFARRFQVNTGQAPYAWYLNLRVAEAQELLRASNIPLVEIALRLGFCSQSHFQETFRRRVGVTPRAWRRRASIELA